MLTPAQRAAHARLAALPATRHYRKAKDMDAVHREVSEAAARTRRMNGTDYKQAPPAFGQLARRKG